MKTFFDAFVSKLTLSLNASLWLVAIVYSKAIQRYKVEVSTFKTDEMASNFVPKIYGKMAKNYHFWYAFGKESQNLSKY